MENDNLQPQVSVIIPAYNRRAYIQKTIESVLKQTYTNYEIIAIDDASTDGTPDVIAQNYPQIRLIRFSQNRGASAARNAGIKIAKGNFIAFLDSDDIWLPNYLMMQLKALEQNKDAIFVFCDTYTLGSKGKRIKSIPKVNFLSKDLILYQLRKPLISTMSTVVVRKDALLRAGFLNETLKIVHDRELYLRLLLYGNLIHVPETLVCLVEHADRLTRNYKVYVKDVFQLLDIFFNSEAGQQYKQYEAEVKSIWALRIARYLYAYHDYLLIAVMILKMCYFFLKSQLIRLQNRPSDENRF